MVEAAVELYGRELAVQLGLPCPGPLTAEIGEQISAMVRKDDVVQLGRRIAPAGSARSPSPRRA